MSDDIHLQSWLSEPGVLRNFAMGDPPEINDSVARWVAFSRYRCSLTGDWKDPATGAVTPCAIGTLWLCPYRKLAHQCQFGMIVSKEFRRKGVGSAILNQLCHLAKEYFNIELIHLEMYEGNPAEALYKKFGFREFGRQAGFLKDHGEYYGRVLMERNL